MKSKNKNYETNESGGAGFTTGLFIGAALGAGLALLYAPKSGEQTRQQLKDLADEQKDKLKDQWDRTREKAVEAVNSAKEKLDNLGEQAKDAVDEYADKTKNQVDRLADNAKITVEKFQRHPDDFGEANTLNA